jgi:hypothetical protein
MPVVHTTHLLAILLRWGLNSIHRGVPFHLRHFLEIFHTQLLKYRFPQSFMPSLPGMGFPPPAHGGPNAPVDLTAGSHKRELPECVAEQSKSTKKRRVARKKPKIIQLDDVKDEVDVVKSGGH